MNVINVFKANSPLQVFTDKRGTIADVFYNKEINHVALIQSEQGVVRGNHYHKQSTQHILITQGSLEYWYCSLNETHNPQCYIAVAGDLVTSLPNEIHTMRMQEYTEFVTFTEGVRGGQDYEADTFRVDNIIPQ